MLERYISIVGTELFYKMTPFEIGNIVTLIKDKKHRIDADAIAVYMPIINKVGYVSNDQNSIAKGTQYASGIYGTFEREVQARVVFSTRTKVICKLLGNNPVPNILTSVYKHNDCKSAPLDHLLKVFAYVTIIAQGENIEHSMWEATAIAALVHDLGVVPNMEKHGNESGVDQEMEEEEEETAASRVLKNLYFSLEDVNRIDYLVGKHHTYTDESCTENQILIEADYLVNMRDENYDIDKIKEIYAKVFKTNTGKLLLKKLFL